MKPPEITRTENDRDEVIWSLVAPRQWMRTVKNPKGEIAIAVLQLLSNVLKDETLQWASEQTLMDYRLKREIDNIIGMYMSEQPRK